MSASSRQYPDKQAKQQIYLLWGEGQVRRDVLKQVLPYFLHSSQKASLQLSSAIWVGKCIAHIGGVKTRCLQFFRFCKLPSMRFCDVCMYYCWLWCGNNYESVNYIMCQLHTHGSTQEKSRDFANKSMYAKLTTRLTRYHETVWGETCVNVAGKLSWFSAQQAPGLQCWPTLGWQGCQRPCKMESKMAHWRSPRTILLMKIFFIFSYSLFFPFSIEMWKLYFQSSKSKIILMN